MRILLLDTSHLPTIGGKELVVHHLASEYAERGLDVRVAGPGAFFKHRKKRYVYPIDRYPSVPGISEDKQWRLRVHGILKRHRYDIVHAHTTYPCAYHALQRIRKMGLNLPVIVTPHGEDIHMVPEINFGKRLNPELNDKIGWAVQHSYRATSISDAVRTSLLEVGCPAQNIADISNGVDTRRFEKSHQLDVFAHFNIPKSRKLIVSIGNYHPRKGHDISIAAMAQLAEDDAHLVIVGNPNEELDKLLDQHKVRDRVTIAGIIPYPLPGSSGPDVLAALLQNSTAYVSASVAEGTEGLSLALLEAMAAGAFPIATRVSGSKDVIEEGESGTLVKPGDVTALADAISFACRNPDECRRQASNAQATVKPMSWANIADKYLELYQGAINQFQVAS